MKLKAFNSKILLNLFKLYFLLGLKYKVFHIKNLHALIVYKVDCIHVFVLNFWFFWNFEIMFSFFQRLHGLWSAISKAMHEKFSEVPCPVTGLWTHIYRSLEVMPLLKHLQLVTLQLRSWSLNPLILLKSMLTLSCGLGSFIRSSLFGVSSLQTGTCASCGCCTLKGSRCLNCQACSGVWFEGMKQRQIWSSRPRDQFSFWTFPSLCFCSWGTEVEFQSPRPIWVSVIKGRGCHMWHHIRKE
jgi:hypothetical protein